MGNFNTTVHGHRLLTPRPRLHGTTPWLTTCARRTPRHSEHPNSTAIRRQLPRKHTSLHSVAANVWRPGFGTGTLVKHRPEMTLRLCVGSNHSTRTQGLKMPASGTHQHLSTRRTVMAAATYYYTAHATASCWQEQDPKRALSTSSICRYPAMHH